MFAAAKTARAYLNGFHLFDQCHTLRIEFAWTERLNVLRNDDNTWDITRVQPSYCQVHSTYPQHQLEDASFAPISYQQMINYSPSPGYEPNLMIVTGLTFTLCNTRKLFNLLSIYGNVAKIQFLSSEQCNVGTAMVEMFDTASAECCMYYLNELPVGCSTRLQIFWANRSIKIDEQNSYMLPDASRSFEDFTMSRNQRFLIPRPIYWIQPPSRFLRFYNTPMETTRESMFELFARQNINVKEVKLLPNDETSQSKSVRGVLEFSSLKEATHGKIA